MRKLFLQREVIEIGNVLGWDMRKQTLYYWQMRGHFPEPVAKIVKNTSWYREGDIVLGFLNVAQKYGRDYGESNINLAIKAVLENNKKLTQEISNFKKVACDG